MRFSANLLHVIYTHEHFLTSSIGQPNSQFFQLNLQNPYFDRQETHHYESYRIEEATYF